MSLTITGLCTQLCSIVQKGAPGAYGHTPSTVVVRDAYCRFVEKGETKFDTKSGAQVTYGKAQAWFVGDVPVRKGHKFVLQIPPVEYTIIDVYKGRDLFDATVVDHTKVVLE